MIPKSSMNSVENCRDPDYLKKSIELHVGRKVQYKICRDQDSLKKSIQFGRKVQYKMNDLRIAR